MPAIRPRRLRTTPALRRLVAQTRVSPAQLVLPVFVREGLASPRPIDSLPGVSQHSLGSLAAIVDDAAAAGLRWRDAVRGSRDSGRSRLRRD